MYTSPHPSTTSYANQAPICAIDMGSFRRIVGLFADDQYTQTIETLTLGAGDDLAGHGRISDKIARQGWGYAVIDNGSRSIELVSLEKGTYRYVVFNLGYRHRARTANVNRSGPAVSIALVLAAVRRLRYAADAGGWR